jgi:hypothetical protein
MFGQAHLTFNTEKSEGVLIVSTSVIIPRAP